MVYVPEPFIDRNVYAQAGHFDINNRSDSLGLLLGDSRVEQYHIDGLYMNISNANVISWANCISGWRFAVGAQLGRSGNRSDQMLARLSTAKITKVGLGIVHTGVNDIADAFAGYVSTDGPMAGTSITVANSALHAFTNIKAAYEYLRAAGVRRVIVFLEPGATNMNAAQVGQVHELNQRLREWSEQSGAILFDLPFYVWDPLVSGSLIAYKAGYLRAADVTHLSAMGGMAGGAGLAPTIQQLLTPRPYELRSINEINSVNSNINQLANPMFATATGGVAGGGITGSIPGLWNVSRTGAATAVVSNGTPADGSPGKETILTCTFSAAGETVYLYQDWTLANWSPNDIVQSSAEMVCDDASAVAGMHAYLQANGDTGQKTTMAMSPIANTAFTTGLLKTQLLTERMVIPNYATKSWVTSRFIVTAAAAGNATVRIRRPSAKRRFS